MDVLDNLWLIDTNVVFDRIWKDWSIQYFIIFGDGFSIIGTRATST